MKPLRTAVEGSRKKRIYDVPQTPFDRLKACGQADREQIAKLEELKATLNPLAACGKTQKGSVILSGVPCGRRRDGTQSKDPVE